MPGPQRADPLPGHRQQRSKRIAATSPCTIHLLLNEHAVRLNADCSAPSLQNVVQAGQETSILCGVVAQISSQESPGLKFRYVLPAHALQPEEDSAPCRATAGCTSALSSCCAVASVQTKPWTFSRWGRSRLATLCAAKGGLPSAQCRRRKQEACMPDKVLLVIESRLCA